MTYVLGGPAFATLANEPGVGAWVHRLPCLEVESDLSLRLLVAWCAGDGHVQRPRTNLADATLGRSKKALEITRR
jgi:hypothetical protein